MQYIRPSSICKVDHLPCTLIMAHTCLMHYNRHEKGDLRPGLERVLVDTLVALSHLEHPAALASMAAASVVQR